MSEIDKTWAAVKAAHADALAAKDREGAAREADRFELVKEKAALSNQIAALREFIRSFTHADGCCDCSICEQARGLLSATPAPDRAESDENMGLAGARAIGEARTSSLRSFSWENRYDFNAPGPAEAMRDGAIYAAVSRAKDPKAYDKMLDEVTADARAVLAAEAMRAKCEAIARDMRGWMQPRDVADAIAALKGNGEGK